MANYHPPVTPALGHGVPIGSSYIGPPPISVTASTTVTGGQLVEPTGDNTVGPGGNISQKIIGIAGNDATTGQAVTVWPLAQSHDAVIANTVVLAAGDPVRAAAAGQVSKYVVGTDPTPSGGGLDRVTVPAGGVENHPAARA